MILRVIRFLVRRYLFDIEYQVLIVIQPSEPRLFGVVLVDSEGRRKESS